MTGGGASEFFSGTQREGGEVDLEKQLNQIVGTCM